MLDLAAVTVIFGQLTHTLLSIFQVSPSLPLSTWWLAGLHQVLQNCKLGALYQLLSAFYQLTQSQPTFLQAILQITQP